MSSTLTFETLRMPGANLGGENPLPPIQAAPDLHNLIQFDDSVPEEDRAYFNYGKVAGILPYRIQDEFDRDQQPRDFPCAVLENKHLRAVFFPQYGGKLWSLYDKDHQRHLLHVNPVFQPCNLALRHAWTSGGVEWNIGMTGHTPYTLSPLHATSLKLDDGTPVLRMYEWERIRQVSYQIDAYLPEDSRFLFVRVRLRNTSGREMPIYWWSNIAVDETPGTRVLAPAEKAYCFGYAGKMTKRPVPNWDDIDHSYTTQVPSSMDIFFDIPSSNRKWEAALDEEGKGLVQTSTDRLQGRKLFMWGNSAGGHHWQEFLAAPGKAYLEIQAGLAHTQMEHLPMPADACWQWLEAYGYLESDPEKVHGEWETACQTAEADLEKSLPRAFMEEELQRVSSALDVAAAEPFQKGSGWAALELRRMGEGDCFPGEKAAFGAETMGADQQPWLSLLETGVFPNQDPSETPAAFLTQKEWIPLLEKAASSTSDHWHTWFQLGVAYDAQGDLEAAKKAFETSMARTPNGWALRCLAVLDLFDKKVEEAADKYREAYRLLPILPLAIECGNALLRAKKYAELDEFFRSLPEAFAKNGRIRAQQADAALCRKDFDGAQRILEDQDLLVADMREGERLLSDLWFRLHLGRLSTLLGVAEPDDAFKARVRKEYPVPKWLDYRMSAD